MQALPPPPWAAPHQQLHRPARVLPSRHAAAARRRPPSAAAGFSWSASSYSTDALDSDDPIHALPLHVYTRRGGRTPLQQQSPFQLQHHLHLEQLALVAGQCCYPVIAAAYLAAGTALLAAPAHALQLFGAAAPSGAAADALAVTFARLLGGTYLLQAAVASMVQGCAARGQLHGTSCQRMLLASLLAMPGNVMALSKVVWVTWSPVPAAWCLVLAATLCCHVVSHLPHHPWFLVKVLWPVVTTMAITDVIQLLLPALMEGGGAGAGRLQALAAALLSVKACSRLSRLAAGSMPRVARRVLGPAAGWLAKRTSQLLPLLARRLGTLAPKVTRLGGRLAGRMAPRYAKDQFVGSTMQMAFPDADGGMTQAVAKSIDLMPPKTPAAHVCVGLLILQLALLLSAYTPGLLFHAASEAAAGATAMGHSAAAAGAATAAASTAAAADWNSPALRLVKFAWGSGFFVSAFACNCLKTAADRHHSWAPQNRQLAAAVAVTQAMTAWAVHSGLQMGAVKAGGFAWTVMASAAAGACFCAFMAASGGGAGARAPRSGWQASFGATRAASAACNSLPGDAAAPTGAAMHGGPPAQLLQLRAADAAAMASAAAVAAGPRVAAAEPSGVVPLSSAECEQREHADPEYAAFSSAGVLLLTLLQLAL